MIKYYLILLVSLLLACNDDTIGSINDPCDNCNNGQVCINSECGCPSKSVKMGNKCLDRKSGYYFGDMGRCFGTMGFRKPLDNGSVGYIAMINDLYSAGSHSIHPIDDNSYVIHRFLQTNCDIRDTSCYAKLTLTYEEEKLHCTIEWTADMEEILWPVIEVDEVELFRPEK